MHLTRTTPGISAGLITENYQSHLLRVDLLFAQLFSYPERVFCLLDIFLSNISLYWGSGLWQGRWRKFFGEKKLIYLKT